MRTQVGKGSIWLDEVNAETHLMFIEIAQEASPSGFACCTRIAVSKDDFKVHSVRIDGYVDSSRPNCTQVYPVPPTGIEQINQEILAALKACQLQMLQSNNDSEYAQEANDLAIAAIARAEAVAA
jgi:hypothetical protein